MTEQDYINATELANVRSAFEVLRQITPETSSVIDREYYQNVMSLLAAWRDDLYEEIQIEQPSKGQGLKALLR